MARWRAPQKPHSMVPSYLRSSPHCMYLIYPLPCRLQPRLTFVTLIRRLLLFGSGVPTAEKPSARRFYLMTHGPRAPDEDVSAWTAYKAYLRSTSLLVPLPPALYRRLPEIVKRTVLLDWPVYRFDEKTDGPRAIEEERGKLGEGIS